MNLTIYTDGGSLNNPGQAAYGFLIYEGKKLLHKQNERIGVASNNVAEYTALIKALEYVKENLRHPPAFGHPLPEGGYIKDLPFEGSTPKGGGMYESIRIISDSLLMVSQVKGLYKVKNADMKPLHSHVKMLEMEIGMVVTYTHVLRDKNAEADALVKEALGK
ncbi:MAG: ribonuclease HI family protein [Candidatus Roizmanbacteria bacterium]|nr:ribonuclease HI family protein [Candidatus Roizmanbacteria bacterium]